MSLHNIVNLTYAFEAKLKQKKFVGKLELNGKMVAVIYRVEELF